MKTKLFFIGLFLLSFCSVQGQRQNKIGYIDMNYILENVPEYKDANAQLDLKIEQWKSEIDKKQTEIDNLKEALENERPLLTQDLIDERKEEIKYQEDKLQEYQQKRFGADGDMMKQSKQIARPLEDQIFNIIQEIGLNREYDFIFDSSSDALMLFSAERHDISNQVLASINRNSSRLKREKQLEERQNKGAQGEEVYKSVRQSRIDREKRAEREAEIRRIEKERQDHFNRIREERDNARNAKIEEQKARREKLMKERQTRLDSVRNAREQMLKERQQRRDSILKARQNH